MGLTGHSAVLHGCTVEDEAFVGMGATLLDGVVVENHGMVAAGALVRQNTRIPSGEVITITLSLFKIYPFFLLLWPRSKTACTHKHIRHTPKKEKLVIFYAGNALSSRYDDEHHLINYVMTNVHQL